MTRAFPEREPMGQWGFVLLAYGIVWCGIAVYVALLKRRIRRAATAMQGTHTLSEAGGHETE